MMALQVTQFEPRVLTWWASQRAKIDMEPSYQRRGGLWSKEDKAFLIDSILNDYDIPKLYIADFTFGNTALNEKNLPYAIIDGKQRFEALFGFLDGKVVLNEDFVWLENRRLKLGGLGYADLRTNHPDIAAKIENYHLSVMRVIATQKDRINELFVRLNRNKPLSGAEIRNAMTGPAPHIIREIAKHPFFGDSVRFQVTRGQGLNAAAKVLMFEFYGDVTDTKKVQLDEFAASVRGKQRAKLEQAARRTVDVLDQLAEIFTPRDPLLGSAGVVPVYYWFVRDTPREHQPRIREFLVNFDRQRKAAKGHPSDKDLVAFEQLSRSTNDVGSYRGRVEILEERFAVHLTSTKQKRR
ncbi:MAG TPA: DUF262 domain-containing protein [Gemmatimonadaceae bacterium]|jgi:hypothetical protein